MELIALLAVVVLVPLAYWRGRASRDLDIEGLAHEAKAMTAEMYRYWNACCSMEDEGLTLGEALQRENEREKSRES